MAALTHVAQNRNGQGERDRLAIGEQMLRDRGRGMTPSEMMAKYDVSKATLYRRLEQAVQARLAPTVDKYREEQNLVLDDMVSRWEQQITGAEAMIHEGTVKESMSLVERGMQRRAEALAGLLRVAERRAKLMGLDAPVRADVNVTVTSATDAAIEALAAEIGAA